jgi:choline dehydrogenase-like flavoprotein
MVVILTLGFAACAHDHALERHEVGAMQNDSPAISPWTGPIPNEAIQQDRLYVRGFGDEN